MACSLLGKSKRGVFSKACKLKNDSCKNFQMPAGWGVWLWCSCMRMVESVLQPIGIQAVKG